MGVFPFVLCFGVFNKLKQAAAEFFTSTMNTKA